MANQAWALSWVLPASIVTAAGSLCGSTTDINLIQLAVGISVDSFAKRKDRVKADLCAHRVADAPLAKHHSAPALVSYASPIGVAIFLWMPTISILPGLYAKHFGLSFAAIAAVILIARVFDGFTDPLIGYLADRRRAAGSSYKMWVSAGALGMLIAAYFLFSPPNPVSQMYYLGWSLAFYVAWSVVDIPHAAWGGALATSYLAKARVYSFRAAALFCGLSCFFGIPFLPFLASQEYTPGAMQWTVYIGAGVMLIALAAMAWAPEGERSRLSPVRDSLRQSARSILNNRPLLSFLAAYWVGGISYGMWFGLGFIYLDSFLHLADKIAIIFFTGNLAGVFSIPLWLWLTRKTSKSVAWAVATALFVFLLGNSFWVDARDPWWVSLILVGGGYISLACVSMAAQATLADVTDYGELKFRRNREATHFALLTLSNKLTSGLGAGLALWIVGHFGFSAEGGAQTERGIWGLHLAFVILPVSCALVAIVLIMLSPITPRRHKIIRRRLERRVTE